MRKFLWLSFLMLACVLVSDRLEAAPGVRAPRASQSIFGTTSVVGISTGAAVVYSVTLGTGTAGTDFVVLFDSGSVLGLASGLQASGGYKLRVNASSTTQNTTLVFDPPLQFNNGIFAANSAATLTSVIAYERGRPTSGY